MSPSTCLPASFYNRSAVVVARELLGCVLVRKLNGQRLSGIITEAEAYEGEEDLASHARVGRTPRTVIMYGPPGRAYVYFTYGMHWMLNVVTGPEGFPAAVLIRALQPVEGLQQIAARRAGQPEPQWCNGPAKLCQALGITGSDNGVDLLADGARAQDGSEDVCPVRLMDDGTPPPRRPSRGTRIGIKAATDKRWRFWVPGDPHVSGGSAVRRVPSAGGVARAAGASGSGPR